MAAWPGGAVIISVGAAPGSANDLTARTVADYLAKATGQPFVVDNRTAGTGADMMAFVASQPADGTTVGLWSASSVSVLASGVLPYDVDDYAYVVRTTGYPLKFCVEENSDIATMEDFIDRVKAGETFNVGGPYTGSLAHLTALRFADIAGIEFTWVPFDGSPAVYSALLGNQVDIAFLACRGVDGTRNLAVTTPERQGIDPETPTLMELGYDFEAVQWLGFVVAGDTDPAIVEQIQAAVIEATKDSAFIELAEGQEVEVQVVETEAFTEGVREDVVAYAELQKRLGLD
jgi:tripartite-type tricarboxylate transporter receptor subunit TctC